MRGGNEGRQSFLFDVLKFIDEECECGVGRLCGCTCGFKQRLQVMFEIAVVGEPRLRFEIEPDLDILILELERVREPGESPEGTLSKVLGLFVAGEPQERLAQLGSQNRRERSTLWRLDSEGLDARGLRLVTHAVQENGLANTPGPDQQHALRGQGSAYSRDRHSDGFA